MSHKIFISSDISVDERLVEIAEESPESVLLWPWLLTALDDWGRATAHAKRLKYTVFPALTTVTPQIITEAIARFERVGLLELYEVDGKWYMAVPAETWFKYQTHIRVEKRDNDKSRLPAPPSAQLREGARDVAKVRAVASKSQPSPSPSPSLSPTPTDISPLDSASGEGFLTTAVAAERARAQPNSHAPVTAPVAAAAPAISSLDDATLKYTAEEVARRTRLHAKNVPRLIDVLKACPLSPERIIAEAASYDDWLKSKHRSAEVRVFYERWLKPCFEQQQQPRNDEGQHHATLQPSTTAAKANDFDEERYNAVFAEMVRKQRDSETA